VTEAVEELERRITHLRTAVREAVLAGDRERASALRRELRQAEQDWDDALAHAQEAGAEDHEGVGREAPGQDRGEAVLAGPANAASAQAPQAPGR
jgi:hypothetical protein